MNQKMMIVQSEEFIFSIFPATFQVCTKEGFLMKQTSSFQRWRRRYFKLKGRTLYYAKDTKVGQDYFTSSVRNIYITKVVPTSNF